MTEASGVDGNCPEMSLPEHELTQAYARSLDEKDELKEFRVEFLIPTKSQLKKTKIGKGESQRTISFIKVIGLSGCEILFGKFYGMARAWNTTVQND